jgi:hypothetical protein
MPPRLSPEEIELLAHRRARAKMGWYLHACIYVVVNAVFFLLSVYGYRHRPWSPFPVLGWGIGLALHGISVFVLGKGSSLRERMVARERERLQREQERRW